MADGDYEHEDSLERRMRVVAHAATKSMRAEIESLKKQLASTQLHLEEAERTIHETQAHLRELETTIVALKNRS